MVSSLSHDPFFWGYARQEGAAENTSPKAQPSLLPHKQETPTSPKFDSLLQYMHNQIKASAQLDIIIETKFRNVIYIYGA